ncbi:MAG: ATP-binding cassette domain-containing protein [Pantoea sp.]|nr:ATP-binding cassette domain-containing protein [Pantoea sp.]
MQPPHDAATFTLDNVSFHVPGRTLLHPLSLTFPPGKVTALIGHNGSGKSTLLKMLGRHQTASEGRVLLNGTPVEAWNSKAFAREVAYLPQQLPAAEGMTVRELVAIGRYPWHGALGRFRQEDRVRVEEAIAQVGLKPLAARLVEAARYCDHLVALRGGKIIAEGAPEAIMQPDVLGAIYGIPMGILPHPQGGAAVSFVY